MRKRLIGSRGEISTIVVVGLLVLLGAVALVTTTLNRNVQDPRSEASESCNFDSGQALSLGSTETNASNMENRWPISAHPHEYDVLGPGYYVLKPNTNQDVLNLTKQDGGAVDSKMNGFMGSMFGYKPTKLTAAHDVSYGGSVPQGNDTAIKGDAPVLEIPTEAGNTAVKVPSTGYDIGGGYEAMVVFATADRVTIHIGRHEYFVGSGQNNCNGGTCSGGYWIYVKGICVDKQIQQAYNNVKAAQQSAGADKNPIQLPMVRPGQILGKATGTSVIVGVRDNGPFITTSKPVYWEGVPSKDVQPTTAQTTTPQPTTVQPTAVTASPTPTPVSCRPGQTKCPGTNICVDFQDQCQTPTPTPPSGQCASPEVWCTSLNRCTGRTACPTATPTPSSGQCASPEVWCTSLNRCTGRTSCPTPTTAVTPVQSYGTFRTTSGADTAGELIQTPDGRFAIIIQQL
ncbi:hypothetical protein IPM65_02760 [Candidatus Roizmanbacteria bacterium]|nr:MAG: hypothetical protein IPM65_02760 [Candidatus Roizmanbacteria bacterium]